VALHGRAQPPAHHGRRRTFRQKTVRPSSDAHEAVLAMDPLADERAPGAAVTVAPCGHWDHDPPCPLTPHHNRADRVDGEVRVRTLFAVEPELEDTVRHGVDVHWPADSWSARMARQPDGNYGAASAASSGTTRRTTPNG
jgi:hypothetical protein